MKSEYPQVVGFLKVLQFWGFKGIVSFKSLVGKYYLVVKKLRVR